LRPSGSLGYAAPDAVNNVAKGAGMLGNIWGWLGALWFVLHLLGVAAAVHAMMSSRTPQGAVAWIVSLITLPYLALPLYFVFGRNKFKGYVRAIRTRSSHIQEIARGLVMLDRDFRKVLDGTSGYNTFLEGLTDIPFTCANKADLLVDGRVSLTAIYDDIEKAREYVLVQFYIVNDDTIGRDLSRVLRAKANQGVSVYFIYDELGCYYTPETYWRELREAGVHVGTFGTGKHSRLQINFRNHRKMVVVDGRVAHTGGINVGDEYVGKDPALGPWRDTNLRVEGPAVLAFQLSFLADWYLVAGETPRWSWEPHTAEGGTADVLVLPSGPADDLETCSLLHLQLINSAKQRLWIATPYFVPDEPIVQALHLAALRGVDVRVLVPEKADHLLVWLSSFSYQDETEKSGVAFYRYQEGFMHQKALLMDHDWAAVGTANLDNRSLRLSFEITALIHDRVFAEQVEAMLAQDFQGARKVDPGELARKPFLFRLAVAAARLLAPVQ
jgi:cardiolipin synthase A/B